MHSSNVITKSNYSNNTVNASAQHIGEGEDCIIKSHWMTQAHACYKIYKIPHYYLFCDIWKKHIRILARQKTSKASTFQQAHL